MTVRATLVGVLLGGLVGTVYPEIQGLPNAPLKLRLIFMLELSCVFGVLGFALARYHQFRQRIMARIRQPQKESRDSS